MSYDIKKLKSLVDEKDVLELSKFMAEHDLVVENEKIVPRDKKPYTTQADFWDQRQQARKILLNSLNH